MENVRAEMGNVRRKRQELGGKMVVNHKRKKAGNMRPKMVENEGREGQEALEEKCLEIVIVDAGQTSVHPQK